MAWKGRPMCFDLVAEGSLYLQSKPPIDPTPNLSSVKIILCVHSTPMGQPLDEFAAIFNLAFFDGELSTTRLAEPVRPL